MRTLALRDIAVDSHSAKRVLAACRVAGLTSLSPAASIQQIQILSRPVPGTLAALQSTIANVSNISAGAAWPGRCRKPRGSDHGIPPPPLYGPPLSPPSQ